jgi:hypothetical protein
MLPNCGVGHPKPGAFQHFCPTFQKLFLKRDFFDSFNGLRSRNAMEHTVRVLALGRAWTLLACTCRSLREDAVVRHRWEQEKLEASLSCRLALAKHPVRAMCSRHGLWPTGQGKMLAVGAAESPASDARFVRWRF